jgi:hypothetical protein
VRLLVYSTYIQQNSSRTNFSAKNEAGSPKLGASTLARKDAASVNSGSFPGLELHVVVRVGT